MKYGPEQMYKKPDVKMDGTSTFREVTRLQSVECTLCVLVLKATLFRHCTAKTCVVLIFNNLGSIIRHTVAFNAVLTKELRFHLSMKMGSNHLLKYEAHFFVAKLIF